MGKCIQEGCLTRPSYNLALNKTPIYCFNHKKTNMINVVSNLCEKTGCIKQPSYNLPTEIIAILFGT